MGNCPLCNIPMMDGGEYEYCLHCRFTNDKTTNRIDERIFAIIFYTLLVKDKSILNQEEMISFDHRIKVSDLDVNIEHNGDCTSIPITCKKCYMDGIFKEAMIVYNLIIQEKILEE